MPPHGSKLAAGLGALALLWIVIYWAWQPSSPVPRRQPAPRIQPVAAPEVERQPDAAEIAPPPPAATPAAAVIPPEFVDHTVAEGETLAAISERYFKTPDHADAISRSNPLASLTPLRAGRIIRIPKDPTNIQGKPLAPATPQPPNAEREYLVRSGDSLTKIAQLMYGDARLSTLIYEANRDQLKNENTVKQGQRLRIPPVPGTPP